MIKHILENKNSPVVHEVNFPISRKELQRVRLLLDTNFEDMDDDKFEKFGIVKDSSECIIGVSFNDGAALDWSLCCGQNNYYDDVVFQYPDGKTVTLECSYALDNMEIDTETDIYIVKLELQDE